jgi:hypothetical protein
LPATEAEHDRVELPAPAMIVDEIVHDKFVELVVTTRVTVPVKLLTGATDIVEVPVIPVLTLTLAGLAEIVKSCAWKVTVAE